MQGKRELLLYALMLLVLVIPSFVALHRQERSLCHTQQKAAQSLTKEHRKVRHFFALASAARRHDAETSTTRRGRLLNLRTAREYHKLGQSFEDIRPPECSSIFHLP